MSQEVKFVTDSRDQWKFVDVMVTDHPDVIESQPVDKFCVVVTKPFNREYTGERLTHIDSIKDLEGEFLQETVQ